MDEQTDQAMWTEFARRFAAARQRRLTRQLDVLAASASLLGVIALTEACVPHAGVAAAGGYLLLLVGFVPQLVWFGSAVALVSFSAVVKLWAPDALSAAAVLVVGAVLYGLANRLADEATEARTYAAERRIERALLLLPLVLSNLTPAARRPH
jgi:hypothetical protein